MAGGQHLGMCLCTSDGNMETWQTGQSRLIINKLWCSLTFIMCAKILVYLTLLMHFKYGQITVPPLDVGFPICQEPGFLDISWTEDGWTVDGWTVDG